MTPNQIAGRHAVQTQRLVPWIIYRRGQAEPVARVPSRFNLTTAEDAVAWVRDACPAMETWALEARPGTPVVVPQRVDGAA